MRSEKLFIVKLTLFIVTLLVFLPGFMVKKTNTGTVQGTIESIDKEFKFMIVNGTKFSLSPGARIVDEKGHALSIKDLKPGLPVTLEGRRAGEGFSTKGIAVTPPKKKP